MNPDALVVMAIFFCLALFAAGFFAILYLRERSRTEHLRNIAKTLRESRDYYSEQLYAEMDLKQQLLYKIQELEQISVSADELQAVYESLGVRRPNQKKAS